MHNGKNSVEVSFFSWYGLKQMIVLEGRVALFHSLVIQRARFLPAWDFTVTQPGNFLHRVGMGETVEKAHPHCELWAQRQSPHSF